MTASLLTAPNAGPDAERTRTIDRLRTNPLVVLAAAIVVVVTAVALLAPTVAPYGANEFAGAASQSPSLDHAFGTDRLGRDILSRIAHGTRTSLAAAALAVALGASAGTAAGLVSGYRGGIFDLLLQRIVDMAIGLPQLVMLTAIVALLGPSLLTVAAATAVGVAANVTRVIRSATLTEKTKLYVEASRVAGATDARLMYWHVLPNVAPVALVVAGSLLGAAILAQASLAFLGLHVSESSWGADIAQARMSYPLQPWAALFPGLVITFSVLAFNLLADKLRDALDPRLGRRG